MADFSMYNRKLSSSKRVLVASGDRGSVLSRKKGELKFCLQLATNGSTVVNRENLTEVVVCFSFR